MIDPVFKKKWVAALRSKQYCQARGALRVFSENTEPNFGFCCIGVGANLKDPKGWLNDHPESGIWHRNFTHNAGVSIGLSSGQVYLLTKMNDGERKSFDEIADWIEANL